MTHFRPTDRVKVVGQGRSVAGRCGQVIDCLQLDRQTEPMYTVLIEGEALARGFTGEELEADSASTRY